MNFDPTEEQQALRDVVQQLLDRHPTLETARSGQPRAESVWAALVRDLGLHQLLVPEEDGGVDASMIEVALVMQALGSRLAGTPFVGSAVAATTLLVGCPETRPGGLFRRLLDGEVTVAVAIAGDGASPSASREGDGWMVSGTADQVLDAPSAAALVLLCDSDQGPVLVVVDASAPGFTVDPAPSLDLSRELGVVTLEAAPALTLTTGRPAVELWELARERTSLALAAEQLGAAQACLEMALSYAKTRVQFGRPIGSFQAVKHRCADMLVHVESARAVVEHAAWACDHEPDSRAEVVDFAAQVASSAAYTTAASNIQVHGAIAYTHEHDAHLYYKRAVSSRALLEDPAARPRRIHQRAGVEARGAR